MVFRAVGVGQEVFFNLSNTAAEIFWVSSGGISEDTLRLLQHSTFNLAPVPRFLLFLVRYRFAGMASGYVTSQLLGAAKNLGAIFTFEILEEFRRTGCPFAQIAAVSCRLSLFDSL